MQKLFVIQSNVRNTQSMVNSNMRALKSLRYNKCLTDTKKLKFSIENPSIVRNF